MSSHSFATVVNGQRILFLDLEGVMTMGMFTNVPAFLRRPDAVYSREATRLVRQLVIQHGFKIVLITMHGKNDSEALQRRLNFAGIRPHWLYAPDPEAIADIGQSKGDHIMEWLGRNPHVTIENTVAVDDLGIRTSKSRTPYPQGRVVMPDGSKGLQQYDFEAVLKLVGATPIVQENTEIAHQIQPRRLNL